MDFVRFGQVGVTLAGIGVAVEWYSFLNGNTSAVFLGGFVGLIGILVTLTAAVKQG